MKNQMKTPGFRSIRNQILFFSILLTMVPSLGMGWFWFDLSHKATTERVEKNLVNTAEMAERETNLWFKERNYDLHVIADSFVVLDNLEQYQALSEKKEPIETSSNLRTISTYLTLISKQFTEYRRLLVLNTEGQVLAASDMAEQNRVVSLPEDWKIQIIRSQFFTSDAYFIAEDPSPMITMGIPLLSEQDSTQLGFFVMEVRLQGLLPRLAGALSGMDTGEIVLLKEDGRTILSTATSDKHKKMADNAEQMLELFKNPRRLHDFIDDQNIRVVGLTSSFDDLPWQLFLTESYDHVFSGLIRARDQIVIITLFLTILIGAAAALLASQILIPLKALTNGVMRVANGDLDVSVPLHRNDELGIVTGMFNKMVCRLKENQATLEQLATTDSLTELANRKRIMADLAINFENYRRYGSQFSILMIDIDFFKTINDTHGHLVGDAVLVQLARILKESLRIVDSAGRYGGEEFLVILGKTEVHEGLQTAERIRQAVEQHIFTGADVSFHITVSIGLTDAVAEDQNGMDLIGRADKALYEAKAAGRNRVFLATEGVSVSLDSLKAGPQ